MKKKKQIEEKPKRYHLYCHECKQTTDTDDLSFTCECGSEVLTIRAERYHYSAHILLKGLENVKQKTATIQKSKG